MKKQKISLNYEDVSDLIDEVGGHCTADELHGVIVGQLVAHQEHREEAWLALLFDFIDVDIDPSVIVARELMELVNIAKIGVDDSELGFQLLLPNDSESLKERTKAMSRWCQGFLAGYGMAGRGQESDAEDGDDGVAASDRREKLPPEAQEILQDIVSITQVETDIEESEENEENYFVLVEYVRLAVLNVYMDCAEVETEGEPEHLLH